MAYVSNRGILDKVLAQNITMAVNETALIVQNKA